MEPRLPCYLMRAAKAAARRRHAIRQLRPRLVEHCPGAMWSLHSGTFSLEAGNAGGKLTPPAVCSHAHAHHSFDTPSALSLPASATFTAPVACHSPHCRAVDLLLICGKM
jgi:hypothetical protein